MTESSYPNEGAGETSADADVDAGYEDSDESAGGVAGSGGLTDTGTSDSHAADIDAGYDDDSDSPTGGDSGVGVY